MGSTRRRASVLVLTFGLFGSLIGSPQASAGEEQTYLVVYRQQAVPADATRTVQRAGGTLVASYDQIGVLVTRSSSTSFRDAMLRDARIDGVAATAGFASQVSPDNHGDDGQPGDLPNVPASDADTFTPLQWDMRQIHAPEAHAITGGSPAVVAGIIDTGVDKDHPDLVSNIDFSKSASCESGAPDQNPGAWDDRLGHGTHVAGTVAAPANGVGVVGVAPNVKIAAIKSSTDEGYFFPEMVVCSFMWAGLRKLDVVNNSYFADPFLYNCRNDPVQRAIWKAESRAIRFAMQQGVTVVASEGNDSQDHSHPGEDHTSPDYPPGSEVEREVTNACVVVPVEVAGVIGVTAVGNLRQTDGDDDPNDYLKSFYSSYGVSTADITAPGGDSIFGITPESSNGRVLSTYPQEVFCRPDRRLVDPTLPTATYCYLQGTSMAAPHVTGVAALIISRFGDAATPRNGKLRPNQVEAYLQQTADTQPCPTELPAGYEAFTQIDGTAQSCQGGQGHTSWYGAGQVNALRAILHDA